MALDPSDRLTQGLHISEVLDPVAADFRRTAETVDDAQLKDALKLHAQWLDAITMYYLSEGVTNQPPSEAYQRFYTRCEELGWTRPQTNAASGDAGQSRPASTTPAAPTSPSPSQPPPATPTQSRSSTPPSPSAPPSSRVPVSSAADSGAWTQHWTSPSGNIQCGYAPSGSRGQPVVACVVADQSTYVKLTQGIGAEGPLSASSSTFDQLSSGSASVLGYGQSMSVGPFMCQQSDETGVGMACWLPGTEQGFAVKRDSYLVR